MRYEFQGSFPQINYNSPHGACPFLNVDKDEKRATGHEDRAEVEERDGQGCEDKETLGGGDSSQAKSSRKDSTPAAPTTKSRAKYV